MRVSVVVQVDVGVGFVYHEQGPYCVVAEDNCCYYEHCESDELIELWVECELGLDKMLRASNMGLPSCVLGVFWLYCARALQAVDQLRVFNVS